MIVTMEMVYLMTFPFNADSSTLWLMPEVLPADMRADRLLEAFR